MSENKHEVDLEQLKEIYKIFKAYQQANTSSKTIPSEYEKRLRELERNNPYFSRYVYSGGAINE